MRSCNGRLDISDIFEYHTYKRTVKVKHACAKQEAGDISSTSSEGDDDDDRSSVGSVSSTSSEGGPKPSPRSREHGSAGLHVNTHT
jgi:hypothetical protein